MIRLFYLQVLSPSYYSADYTKTRKITPDRGQIYDKNHEPLAVNQTKYELYAEPKLIEDKDILVEKLDEILDMGEATISSRVKMDKDWVAVAKNIDKETKKKIEGLNLKGIGFNNIQQRFYPEASLAAHLVGFLGRDKNDDTLGYFGVEGYYDKDLSGLPGVMKSERDMMNRPIFVGSQQIVGAENGRDIVLTIDKSVQHIIKEHLKDGIWRYQAKAGCVIAVRPQTMEIIGLACLPDFDPENYFDYPQEDFADWAISSTYEPGSTFKPLVMAAAIEEKKIEPDDTYDESGPLEISGYAVSNWDDKYSGKITYSRVLEKSSNVGMVNVGKKLGNELLNEYIVNKYGFGNYTQIDLQGETTGRVKPLDTWRDIDAATNAFGQGISVTGIQLIRAFASVINGGYLMRPYVVSEVIEDGKVRKREPVVQKRVLSERTSKIMKKMLVATVNNAEVKFDIPEGFVFGGKTGTAQIAVEGSYDASKTIASFIGFAPADDPEFLMLVVLQEPGTSGWGSETAAPIFFKIAQDLLVYYNVTPN